MKIDIQSVEFLPEIYDIFSTFRVTINSVRENQNDIFSANNTEFIEFLEISSFLPTSLIFSNF